MMMLTMMMMVTMLTMMMLTMMIMMMMIIKKKKKKKKWRTVKIAGDVDSQYFSVLSVFIVCCDCNFLDDEWCQ